VHHVEKIWEASKDFLERLLDVITNPETLSALFTHWVDRITTERFRKANEALGRLLKDRDKHPITYNHYYIENLQRSRQDYREKILESKIQIFMGVSPGSPDRVQKSFSVSNLAKTLSGYSESESDMDSFACSELLESMQAYYKVSIANNY
jgi:hypothetical protein